MKITDTMLLDLFKKMVKLSPQKARAKMYKELSNAVEQLEVVTLLLTNLEKK